MPLTDNTYFKQYLIAYCNCHGFLRPIFLLFAALERPKKSQWTYNGKNGAATFSWLSLIGSILYLQIKMTYMRAWMSLKFGQIRLLVSMATDRVIMEKTVCHFFSAVFYLILFILAGNDDMHESSEEFEIWSDLTTDSGVSCP